MLYKKSIESQINCYENDLILDLKECERELYGRLDPSIRYYIQKRGVGVKQHTYVGFDTEYVSQGYERNEMVSAQLAVSTKSYVRIPKRQFYKSSVIDGNTHKIKNLNCSSTIFNYKKLENSIQILIDETRVIKFNKYDLDLMIISEVFRIIRGINYHEQDDQIVFALPRTPVQPYIKYGNEFSLGEMLRISSGLVKHQHVRVRKIVDDLLVEVSGRGYNLAQGRERMLELIYLDYSSFNKFDGCQSDFEEILPLPSTEILEEQGEKRLTRKTFDSFSHKLSVTYTKTYFVVAHLTPADLSLLSDFDELKEDLSIVNGSFVTLGKALKVLGRSVQVRDTMLLAPGGGRSLARIGKLYGDKLNKIEISKMDLNNMQAFLDRDKKGFDEYALRDALISLVHAAWMEDFNFKTGVIGIPISLSSIGRGFVKSSWLMDRYDGYQLSSKYLIGDVSSCITPKGLNAIHDVGFVLPYFIKNYKGGRNECFMFGIDRDTDWYDYDLVSAYTTILSMAGHPDYESCSRLSVLELQRLKSEDILFSYLIINAEFEFPSDTKYPSIPCYVDENCTVYPLTGSCVITGAEYLLALSQKCVFKLKDIYRIPFKSSDFKENKPFYPILKLVQEQRREHLKGTVSNLMYKEIGNSIYGSVVRGISNKKKFDVKSKGTVRMSGDELSNPLIASWTTAFIRSIIGECLHSIQKLGGLTVSVTTDGFISNIPDLEQKISSNYLLGEFCKIRVLLSEDTKGLELKSSGRGILAWSTRGQLGLESKIIATTGFQHHVYTSKKDLLEGFITTFKTEGKGLEFVQSRLRSAMDVYKKGGHVTNVLRDQVFRMHFDHRRILQWEVSIPHSIEVLIDSKPLLDITQGKNFRYIGRLCKNKQYGLYLNKVSRVRVYKKPDELVVRAFLKGLFSSPPQWKLNRGALFGYKQIVEFVKGYNASIPISEAGLAQIKRRVVKGNLKNVAVQQTTDSDLFLHYVKQTFKSFDMEAFYKC